MPTREADSWVDENINNRIVDLSLNVNLSFCVSTAELLFFSQWYSGSLSMHSQN